MGGFGPIIVSSNGRGSQGPPGPPGSSDATALLGIPLDPSIGAPADGAVLGYDAGTGKYQAHAYTALDLGTF